MKILFKVPLIVDINGRTESIGPGQILDLPDATAKELVRVGHAEVAEEEFEKAVHPVARRRGK